MIKEPFKCKVCVRPGCEAVFHNIEKKDTKCIDCHGKLIAINKQTFIKKYQDWHFQYDYKTMKYYRPRFTPYQPNLID